MDMAVRAIGLVVEELRASFTPEQAVPPRGGGAFDVFLVPGEFAPPPPFNPECRDCGPMVWVRLVNRFRTKTFPAPAEYADCGMRRAVTVEAGVARCSPLPDGHSDLDRAALEAEAAVQWDDSWRMDSALCRVLRRAPEMGFLNSAVGIGEPYGPEGMVVAWLQTVTLQY